MNDYIFGNYIYEKRIEAGLSQHQLAGLLKVSEKAISKWENGKAKPHPDTLKRIAVLFDVSLDELLQLEKNNKNQEIFKIVITGGPCAGKTTGMSWIQNEFTKLGYKVLFIPETATELIGGGVTPLSCGSNTDFQKCIMELQIKKEEIFEQAAKTMNAEKILIVCDRGLIDNKAYMDDIDFAQVSKEINKDEVALRDGYDAVFHLVSAAKGAEKFYTTENNSARTEGIKEAAALDDKLIATWTGHPHFRVIDNSSDFEDKMKNLIAEIRSFLGEPEPFEIERKYLIEYPDLKWLEKIDNCTRVEIIQTYLNSPDSEETRVRQRGENGSYTYTKTTKKNINNLKRIEIEKRLSKDEYLSLLMNADINKRQIRKNRYCLMSDNQYFEIDIYPFWQDKAIVEIELKSEDEEVHFPKKLKVIREVTDDVAYKNASLAKIERG